jgi:hypothetical protein
MVDEKKSTSPLYYLVRPAVEVGERLSKSAKMNMPQVVYSILVSLQVLACAKTRQTFTAMP